MAGLRVNPEPRMQEKGVVGTFLAMKLHCFALDKRNNRTCRVRRKVRESKCNCDHSPDNHSFYLEM